MHISVIIPTLNRARVLNRTLFSLANQAMDLKFEVIVVDNGSSDDTREICNRYQASFENFRYIYDDRPGLLIGRHVGAHRATGKVLSFIDDDVVLPPYWLQGIGEVFAPQSQVVLATGNNYPFFESPPPEWLDQMWCQYGSGKHLYQLSFLILGNASMAIDPGLVWGLNFHIRRDTFFELGGFNPDILPARFQYFIGDGELGITRRMRDRNLKAFFDPRLSLYHTATSERLTEEYFIRRSYTEGLMTAYTNFRKGASSDSGFRFLLKNEKIEKVKLYLRHLSAFTTNPALFRFKRDVAVSFTRGYNDYLEQLGRDALVMEYCKEVNYLDIDAIAAKYYGPKSDTEPPHLR